MAQHTPFTTPVPMSTMHAPAQQPQRKSRTLREVLVMWIENVGVGFGVGIGLLVILWLMGAPSDVLLQWPLAVGVVLFAVLMVVRGVADEWMDVRTVRRMQMIAIKLREALDEAEDELEQLDAALNSMQKERDLARFELTKIQAAAQQAQGKFTPASNTQGPVVKAATELIRMNFELGRWQARDRAIERLRWNREQWDGAYQLLRDAGVVATNGKQTRVVAPSLDAALLALNNHISRVKSVYVSPALHRQAREEDF